VASVPAPPVKADLVALRALESRTYFETRSGVTRSSELQSGRLTLRANQPDCARALDRLATG
jgi:hypothetical protein